MAFKTFTVGEVASASDVNTFLMKQTMIVCTSGTRPSSPAEGWHIYETDTDKVLLWDGTGWAEVLKVGGATTFTPTWTSTGTAPALGNGTILGRHIRITRLDIYYLQLTWGTTTTGGTGTWQFDLPITRSSAQRHGGGGFLVDQSAVLFYPVAPRTSAQIIEIITNAAVQVSATVPFTWANTDELSVTVILETSAN